MPIVLDVKKGDYPKFSQATKDIEVYKVLKIVENGVLKSMFYDYIYFPTFNTRWLGLFIKTYVPGRTKTREFLVSTQGIYSFYDMDSAKKFMNTYVGSKGFTKDNLTIVKAIIPKRAMYLQHKNQYISNQLMLINI